MTDRPSHTRKARPGLAGWLGLGLLLAARKRSGAPVMERSGRDEVRAAPAEPRSFAPRDARGADTPSAERARGRDAEKPSEIPARGWKDILWRTVKEFGDDDIPSVSRSIAFAGILALFPALAAFVAIYGLFADVSTAEQHLAGLTGIIPAEAATFLGEQLVRIAAAHEASLSFTFIFGLLLSLWSANAGMKALFKGLNIAYEEEEKRGFVRLNLITLACTLGAIVVVSLALGAVVVAPILMQVLGLDGGAQVVAWLRWPLLLVVVLVSLAALYRYGPSRDEARWRWVSWGGVAATVLWLGGSALFSWYLANFGNYDATYGSLGAVFGFLMWLWLSSMVVLFGAELNSEIEHQTARDTTEGAPEPIGQRGAHMADNVGPAKTGPILPEPIARRLRH